MANPYETDKLVAEYLLLHYGEPAQVFPYGFGPREALGFPVRCVHELAQPQPGSTALELGCAVGRAAFELSRTCSRVVAIDYSQAFIQAAQRMAYQREVAFRVPDEGELTTECQARLSDEMHPERVEFEVGDATALRADLGSFDLVLAANLLCRLPDPQRLLSRLPELVNPGGRLVITSPYTWMEEYTPRSRWLGGFHRDGEAVRSLSSLQAALADSFQLDETRDVPFLIREHARKYQWSVAQASLWRRAGA
ncbi:MAG: putative 4-mercaptohistidine N1-methyltransferase [Vulcanimicrobiota bacterium]